MARKSELVPLRWHALFFVTVLSVLSVSILVGYKVNTRPVEVSCEKLEEADLMLILLRNTSVFALLLIGYLTYGVLTISLLAFNGFTVGYLTRSYQFNLTLMLIIPHAIFEFMWIIIISYISLLSSYRLSKEHTPLVVLDYKLPIMLSYFLLIVGALIEWKITPIMACG